MNKQTVDMIKKQLLYILPLALLAAGFALLPFRSDELKPIVPAVEEPAFELAFPVNDTITILKPERKNKAETQMVVRLLDAYHYRKLPLNDSVSNVVYQNYLDALDNMRLYFTAADIAAFKRYQYEFDDYLKEGELAAPYQIFAVFKERYYQRLAYVDELLAANKFDFTLDEEFVFDRDSLPWPADEAAMNEVWRKYIKNELLNLKLTGKTTEEAIEVLQKRYKQYKKVIAQYKSSDVYQVFMNSYTETYDPHTSYFNPITAENFDIEMSKSLEGIGARLSKDGDYTVVVGVIPGGPAFKSNQIHENDKIVGVGQGEDGEIVDVVGWRNDDVVQLIRGKKGTVVRLSILKATDGPGATPTIVTLVRDKVNIEDARAESKVYEFLYNDKVFKLGVINIPSFYKDFQAARMGNANFNSTTRDVRKLLADLKKQQIDGLLIDLRRNGGGALDEAVELTGLFIKDGPVVQVRDYQGRLSVEKDQDDGVYFDGPLTVLTSRLSASASEIFAAAIQDYQRGLVVGEQSFGKGTVQNLIGLQRYVPQEEEKLGQLKLTIAKFYRVSGGSTQHKGVSPDIEMPSRYDKSVVGESAYPSALPWDHIAPGKYRPVKIVDKQLINKLRKQYKQRLKDDPDLQQLVNEAERMLANQRKKSVSLNEAKRKAEQEEENKLKQQKDESVYTKPEPDDSPPKELKLKDLYLEESLFILADMVNQLNA